MSSRTNLCEDIPVEGCPSGITTGKCYILTFENGQNFGYHDAFGFYTASSDHQFSKFQVCRNEVCTPDEDIQAGTYFNLQEIYGELPPASEEKERIFVNNAKDGAFMTRTLKFRESTDFVITKWPGGKHCLSGSRYGGAGAGLGLTYEAGRVGATVVPGDDQACVVMTLTEVPCDIRGATANCIGGNTTAAAASPPPGGSGVSNASMPIDGSGTPGYPPSYHGPI